MTVLNFIYSSLEKMLLTENNEIHKNILSQIDFNNDYKDMIIKIVIDNLEEENDYLYDNLATLIALVSFGSQSYIIKTFFSKIKEIYNEDEDYETLKEVLQKTIVNNVKNVINEIYNIVDPVDIGNYYKFLNGIVYEPENYVQGNIYYLNENESILDFYEYNEEYEYLNDSLVEKNEKIVVKSNENNEDYNIKNINLKHKVNLNTIRNPNKLGNMILKNEKINKDTLMYLESNNKFLNAVLHSLFSKLLLEEMVQGEKNQNRISFLLFLKELSLIKKELFKHSVVKFRDFIKENNNDYFEVFKKDLLHNIKIIEFQKDEEFFFKKIFDINNRPQLRKLEEIVPERELIKFDQDSAIKKDINKFFYEKGAWNKKFETEANNDETIIGFVSAAMKSCNISKSMEKIESILTINKDVKSYEDLKLSNEESIIYENILGEIRSKSNLLGTFYKYLNLEKQRFFFFCISQYIKQGNEPTLKNYNSHCTYKKILVTFCVSFLLNFSDLISEKSTEEEKEKYNKLKSDVMEAFTGEYQL